jgi:hypothetical protein
MHADYTFIPTRIAFLHTDLNALFTYLDIDAHAIEKCHM